jgi:protein-S-isoprenylcysteine O-methyltransferase Ste14
MNPTTPDRPKLAGVVAPPPLIFGVPLISGLLLDRWRPLPFLPPEWAPRIGIPIFLGLFVGFPAVLAFRRAATSPNPWRPATALVTSGPYRFTRNPMYLGMLLLYLGGSCWGNSLWPLFFLPLVLWVMQAGVIAREESYLEERFGEAYRQYRARVRRWL